MVIPKDFEEFVKVVKDGKVEFAYQNPYVYMLLAQSGYLQVLALTISPEPDKPRDVFRGVIITRRNSSIKDLHDLKGKKIMIVSHKSAGGYWFQKLYLRRQGIDIDKEAKIIEGKKQEEVILAVYRGEVDAGFVREAALEIAREIMDIKQIRILAFTPYFPNWPFASCKNTSPALAEKVRMALLHFKDKNLLKNARISGFIKANDGNFERLKKWLQTDAKTLPTQTK